METYGNISHAMRENYNEYGVDEYYRLVASSYRNPFFAGVQLVINAFMDRFYQRETPDGLMVLDMAAGSGEATLGLLEWEKGCRVPTISAVQSDRPIFVPPRIAKPRSDRPSLPDDFRLDIVATDPYTAPAYTTRTSRVCHNLCFADLAGGKIPPESTASESRPLWDVIICSFALHLVASPSELFALLYELSCKSRWLVIIAPHKKPEIKDGWGWTRWDLKEWKGVNGYAKRGDQGDDLEIVREKVRMRLYKSVQFDS